MGFEHTKKTPYTPWAYSMAENLMKNLGKVIQTAEEEKLNWLKELQRFLRAYRATPHSMTHMSPAALLFNGRKYKTRHPAPSNKTGLVFDDEVRKQDKFAKDSVTNSDTDVPETVSRSALSPLHLLHSSFWKIFYLQYSTKMAEKGWHLGHCHLKLQQLFLMTLNQGQEWSQQARSVKL